MKFSVEVILRNGEFFFLINGGGIVSLDFSRRSHAFKRTACHLIVTEKLIGQI